MSAAGLQSSHVHGAGALMPNAILNSSKQTSLSSSFPHENYEGSHMGSANGTNRRTRMPEKRHDTPRRDGKVANMDWLAAEIAKRSVVEVQDATGMSEKAVQNVRRKKSKLSFDNLVDLCRNDPDFAAEFAAHIGLIMPGEAEMAGVVTRLVNAHVRRQAGD